MRQAKFILPKNLTILLIILGFFLPTIKAIALVLPPPPGATSGNPTATGIDPANFLRPPTPPGGGVSQDALRKWREADQQQCEADAKGKKNPTLGQAAAGVITKPLKDSINEQLGVNAIPDAVNQTIYDTTNGAAKAIEEDLQTEIQNGVREGLREELPKTLAEKLAAARAEGLTDADIQANRGLFTGLVRDSIRESLPRVLNEDFVGNRVSGAINTGLRRSLQSNLRLNFGKIARPTIETYYRAQIESILKQIPDMVKDQVQTIQDTIKGTQAGFSAILDGLKGCALDPVCLATRVAVTTLTKDVTQLLPEIDQMLALIENLIAQIKGTAEFLTWLTEFVKPENQDKFVEAMISGLSVQLEQALTQPKSIEKLADAITGAISGPINLSINNSINQVLDSAVGPIKALEDAIDSIDEIIINQAANAIDLQLSMTIAQLTKPATIIIDHVGDQIATMIDQTVGATLYPLAQGIVTGADVAGGAIAQGINDVGYGIQDFIFPRPQVNIVPDDFTGPLGPNDMTQLDYDLSLENGIKVVPDSLATLRPGEMSFSDYQAALGSDAPLTGVMSDVSGTAAEATQESVGQITDNALNQVGDQMGEGAGQLTSNIAQGFKSGLGQTFAAGVGSVLEGIPYVGPILAQVAEQIINEAMAGAGMAPVAGGFPVMDVGVIWSTKGILSVNQGISRTSGKILTEEKQTKELTEKILNVQIQSCTNLKVIRRIQLLAEEQMFVWGPDAQKANAAALYNAQVDAINNLVNQGREVSDGMTGVDTNGAGNNKGSLIVGNYNDFVSQAGQEAGEVFTQQVGDLAQDTENYPGLDLVHQSLVAQNSEDPLRGTLTKTQIDTFRDNPQSLSNADYWDTFQKLGDPKNNVYGKTLIAQGLRDQAAAEAESAAAAEYQAGQGYVGTRECVAMSIDGKYCAKWQTLTPGSTINRYAGDVLTSPIREAETSDRDFIKGELPLNTKRVANLSNVSVNTPQYKDTAKQSIFTGKDPCPGPGPCPSSGWPKNTGSSGGLSYWPSLTGNASNDTTNQSPNVVPNIKMPTTAEVIAGTAENKTTIGWQSSNATACTAKNDWYTERVGQTLRTAGMSVGTKGEVTIAHPIHFQASFSRIASTVGLVGPILVTGPAPTTDLLKDKIIFNPINASGIHPDDVFRLTLQTTTGPLTLDVGGPGLTNPPTPLQVLKLFDEAITYAKETDTRRGDELRKYSFAYITTDQAAGTGFMIMSPKLTYELTCSKGEQSIDKSITLSRQP